MTVVTPIYRSSPNSPTGEQVSYDNGKTWKIYYPPSPSPPSPSPPSSRSTSPPPKPPVTSAPPITKKTEEQIPKSAVYIKKLGGVLTSDNVFYKTNNINFLPKGYERGFADFRVTKQGKESVNVIPYKLTQYAKSTKEGTTITTIEERYGSTGKSYNPKEVAYLGGELYIKIPKQMPKEETFLQKYWRQQKYVGYVLTGGEFGLPAIKSGAISTWKVLTKEIEETKIKPYQKLEKGIFGKNIIYKNYKPFNEKVSVWDILQSVSFVGMVSASIPKPIEKTRTIFRANVIPEGELTEVNLISKTKQGDRGYIGVSKSLLKETGKDTSLGISKTFTLSIGKFDRTNIKEVYSFGVIKDFESAGLVVKKGGVSIKYPLGKGQITRSLEKETQGISIRNVLFPQELKTVRTRLPTHRIEVLESFRARTIKVIERSKFIAGIYSPIEEGVYRYIGTTRPFLRVYKSGKTSYIIKEANIFGRISIGKTLKDDFGRTIFRSSGKLTPALSKVIGKGIASISTQEVKRTPSIKVKEVSIATGIISKPSRSLYYGTGQYERTTGGLLPEQIQFTASRQMQITRTLPIQIVSFSGRTSQNNRLKFSLNYAQDTGQRIRQRQNYKQQQSLLQKQMLSLSFKQLTKTTNRIRISKFIPKTKRVIPQIPTPFKLKLKGFGSIKRIFGYRTFYTKKGKRYYLSGLREKGSAIRFGEIFTTKTLRATFGVKKTRYKIAGRETIYKPSSYLFRGYRIKKGRKIMLTDTFIQKRGKRLVFRPEISEIQMARSMKL